MAPLSRSPFQIFLLKNGKDEEGTLLKLVNRINKLLGCCEGFGQI